MPPWLSVPLRSTAKVSDPALVMLRSTTTTVNARLVQLSAVARSSTTRARRRRLPAFSASTRSLVTLVSTASKSPFLVSRLRASVRRRQSAAPTLSKMDLSTLDVLPSQSTKLFHFGSGNGSLKFFLEVSVFGCASSHSIFGISHWHWHHWLPVYCRRHGMSFDRPYVAITHCFCLGHRPVSKHSFGVLLHSLLSSLTNSSSTRTIFYRFPMVRYRATLSGSSISLPSRSISS